MLTFCVTISAPGSYDVEKSEKIIHQSSGAVTFGIKYKEQKPDDIPGKICSSMHVLQCCQFYDFLIHIPIRISNSNIAFFNLS